MSKEFNYLLFKKKVKIIGTEALKIWIKEIQRLSQSLFKKP